MDPGPSRCAGSWPEDEASAHRGKRAPWWRCRRTHTPACRGGRLNRRADTTYQLHWRRSHEPRSAADAHRAHCRDTGTSACGSRWPRPAVRAGLVHGTPPPRRRGRGPGRLRRRLHLRVELGTRPRAQARHRDPGTLADYRDRYALYKSDPDLQEVPRRRALGRDLGRPRGGERLRRRPLPGAPPVLAQRRAAAHTRPTPSTCRCRRSMLARGGVRITDRLDWAGLARLHLLDTRQFSRTRCAPSPIAGGSNVVPRRSCEARLDPALSMLGMEQERWLDASLGDSRAAGTWWSRPPSSCRRRTARQGRPTFWTDGWDGYPAARERLIRRSSSASPRTRSLGGDVQRPSTPTSTRARPIRLARGRGGAGGDLDHLADERHRALPSSCARTPTSSMREARRAATPCSRSGTRPRGRVRGSPP
jgi:hypothetical protein